MLQAPRRWFKRNRASLAIGAGIVGAGYLAGQYIWNKVTETRQRLSDERIAQDNLRRRFRQNQEDCTYTVLALLPTATENILQALPVEAILQELQGRKADKSPKPRAGSELAPSEIPSTVEDDERSFASSSYIHASQVAPERGTSAHEKGDATSPYAKLTKLQLWNQLKITTVTRAFALIYTLALLTLLTRIQLNLLGRRTYLSSVVSLASPKRDEPGISLENRDDDNVEQDYGEDFDTNRKYLTFSWWLLHRGWTMIMEEAQDAVKTVFGSLTPRDHITSEQLAERVMEVRKRIEGSSEGERRLHEWLPYLLPPTSDEELVLRESGTNSSPLTTPSAQMDDGTITLSLRRLLDETADLIESPIFSNILTLLLDSTFSLLIDGKIGTQVYGSNNAYPQTREPPTSTITETLPEGADGVNSLLEESIPAQRNAKLATVLAMFTRQAHVIGSAGDLSGISALDTLDFAGLGATLPKASNEYLVAMDSIGDLESFAAVIYSSHFDIDGVGYDNATTSAGNARDNGIDNETQPTQAVDPDTAPDQALESAWNDAVTS